MAKQLTALGNTNAVNLNNSGTTALSKKVPVASIKLSPVFQELFPIKSQDLEGIIDLMKKQGYDNSQPVHIWAEEQVLIDGHTRLEAAKQVGLYDIPVYEHFFESEEKAVEYALNIQLKRRNLDDSGLVIAVQKLDQLKKTGRPLLDTTAAKGRSSEQTAKALGTNARKVERIRTVLASGEEETIEAVKNGELSINKAYNVVVSPKKNEKKQPDISTAAVVIEAENGMSEDDVFIDEPYVCGTPECRTPSLFEEIREMDIDDMAGLLFRVQNENKLSIAQWRIKLSGETNRYGV
jgi:ParB family chromosome partitioning protein